MRISRACFASVQSLILVKLQFKKWTVGIFVKCSLTTLGPVKDNHQASTNYLKLHVKIIIWKAQGVPQKIT